MDDYLRAMGIERKVLEMEVISKWPELMGNAVAVRTTMVRIDGDRLILDINSSVMREELALKKTEIIQKLNEVAGFELIRDVFFK